MIENGAEASNVILEASPGARGEIQSACATLHDGSHPATSIENIDSQEAAI